MPRIPRSPEESLAEDVESTEEIVEAEPIHIPQPVRPIKRMPVSELNFHDLGEKRWLDWATRRQGIAQRGLRYVKPDELRRIISVAKREGVRPQLGIRMRLLSRSTGKWADSGGEDAKFGLNTAELMAAIELLRAESWEDCFRLLHFHIGSQVPDILTVRKAVQEGARL